MSADQLQDRTIQDFGDQWGRYTDNSGFYGSAELFRDIVSPLVDPADLRGCRVAEVGSGSGRIVLMLFGAEVAEVYAVEPSHEAFKTLRRNTNEYAPFIKYLNLPGDRLPAGLDLDYVLSIGVIHHIPDPRPTVEACFAALKPGGTCLFWLYGKEGNEAYLRFAEPLRKGTTKLPHRLLQIFCQVVNLMLDAYIGLCRLFPLPMRDYMLNVVGRMSRNKRALVIYDQLNPAYAKYYTHAEALALLSNAGFIDVKIFHRHNYSWTVRGTRPK